MTLYIDDDYGWLALALRPECERRGIPLETSDLNTRGFGDVLFITDHGTYSGEVKGAGEILGGMNHCEAQLQKQRENADRCFLAVYGKTEPAPDGDSYALDTRETRIHYTHGQDSGISRTYKVHGYRTNYLGYRTWLARLVSLGVDVYEVPSREALGTQLIALYHTLTTEGDTLRRLIVEKPMVSEQNPVVARLMRTLMGIDGAGIGEELADAIVTWLCGFLGREDDITLARLMHTMQVDTTSLQLQPLRSGKRTVGPAAVKRLRKALGL